MTYEASPLSEPVYRILLALAAEPLHGYAILQRVEGEGFALGTGTLYSALKRLRREGVVAETPAPPGADDDPRRRYYRLTERGSERVRAETRRLRELVRLSTHVDPSIEPA